MNYLLYIDTNIRQRRKHSSSVICREMRRKRTYNVDLSTVGPVGAIGFPGSGPCSTSLWHVTNIEAAKHSASVFSFHMAADLASYGGRLTRRHGWYTS